MFTFQLLTRSPLASVSAAWWWCKEQGTCNSRIWNSLSEKIFIVGYFSLSLVLDGTRTHNSLIFGQTPKTRCLGARQEDICAPMILIWKVQWIEPAQDLRLGAQANFHIFQISKPPSFGWVGLELTALWSLGKPLALERIPVSKDIGLKMSPILARWIGFAVINVAFFRF